MVTWCRVRHVLSPLPADGTRPRLLCGHDLHAKVRWGELMVMSCSPAPALQKQLSHTLRGREKVTGCAPAPQQETPQPQPQPHGWVVPCPPRAAPGHVSPHSSPALLQVLLTGPRLPEPGRAGETQALAAGTGTENSCRRPHSTAPPNPCSALQASHKRSAGIQARARLGQALPAPQYEQRGP